MSFSLREACATAKVVLCLLTLSLLAASCGRSGSRAESAGAGKPGKKEVSVVAVTTAKALAREVPSYIQSTGSLVADETSDVATEVSGQVISTPVNVGAFVRQGAVIARLNDRDARLRLQQAQAGLSRALAGVRQAEVRLGLTPGGNFDASTIPEVRAAGATYDQALAQLRLAEANEKRYRDLVVTGDVAQSVYDQFRTHTRHRAGTGKQRPPATRSRDQYCAAKQRGHSHS